MPMGGTELLIILTIILLFFGAKRIPELARSLGKGTREFRKGVSEDPAEIEELRGEAEGKEELPREEESRPREASVQTAPGSDARGGSHTELPRSS